LLILGVETTGKAGSLALVRASAGEFAVLEVAPLEAGACSAQFIPTLAAMLERQNLSKTDVTAIAAATGPGSFTGLRVGLAAVQALGEALRLPIAAVSLLEAIAAAGAARLQDATELIAVAAAGRGQLYCGWYRAEAGALRGAGELLLPREEFARMGFTGELRGRLVTPEPALAEALREHGLAVAGVAAPDAALIARLGARKLAAGETVTPLQLDANYLRRSDAELSLHPQHSQDDDPGPMRRKQAMRILVVGGTGFIGPHVVTRLVEMGHQVTVFHRGEHEAALPPSVQHVRHSAARMPVVEMPEELRRLEPQVVLHMVAMGERDTEVCVRAFLGIARRLVVLSSGDVYRAFGVFQGVEPGPLEPVPLREQSPLRSVLYPYRKLGGEQLRDYEKILVEQVAASEAALPATILRLPAVYGPLDPQLRFLPYVKRMEDHRPAILLEESQAAWRWTHAYVENVAAAIALAATDPRAAGRIYNVGEPATPALERRIAQIAALAGWHGRVVRLPSAGLPAHLREGHRYAQDIVLDSTRLRRELGFHEPVAGDEGLRRTLAWQRRHMPAAVDLARFDYRAEDAALEAGGPKLPS
jgi:tRNA threonylcarbamoyl adenosine modification protein YeaZ